MHHPKNKADRRRIKFKKEYLGQNKYDREEHVQRRLAEEALEQKEALDVLRRKIPQTEEG